MRCVAELDEEYNRKLVGVVELYERPYDPAEPVVCLDEKAVTLHADVRPVRPAVPGQVAKRDSEYRRCKTANVFCAVEPKTGRHYTTTPGRRRIGPQRNSGPKDHRAMNPHKALDWMLLVLGTAVFVVLLVPVMVLTQ